MMLALVKRAGATLAAVAGSWSAHRCSSMAAALAFYAAFSLAPMLVIIIAVAGFFYGPEAVQGRLYSDITALVGREGAVALQAMVASAWKSGQGHWVGWFAALGTAIGASATFAELNSALDVIWQAKPPHHAVASLIRIRLVSFGLVVGAGFLIVVLLIADALFTFLVEMIFRSAAGMLVWVAQRLVAFALLCLAFAMLLKVLPDKPVRWWQAGVGGVAAGILFTAGKQLFAAYLAHAGTANAFGAASSLAVLMMWLFFSAAVFLLGAELAAHLARRS